MLLNPDKPTGARQMKTAAIAKTGFASSRKDAEALTYGVVARVEKVNPAARRQEHVQEAEEIFTVHEAHHSPEAQCMVKLALIGRCTFTS